MNCCDAYGGCNRGRDCPARATPLRTRNGGEQVNTGPAHDAELPVLMFERPYGWLDETVQRAKELAVALALIAVAAGVSGWAFGFFWR